jgi:hypothetical protein
MENTLHLRRISGHKLVGLHFLDHSTCKGKPEDLKHDDERCDSSYECFVTGILTKETEIDYHITSWVCDKDFNDWETRTDVILKTTMLSPIIFLADLINIKGLPEINPTALNLTKNYI